MKSSKHTVDLSVTVTPVEPPPKLRLKVTSDPGISISVPENILEIWAVIVKAIADEALDIIERLKSYSLGISPDAEESEKGVLVKVEESIQNILYSEESLDLISEMASFKEMNVDIKSLANQKAGDALLNLAVFLGASGYYVEEIFKSSGRKTVVEENQLRKIICYLRLAYASLMSIHLNDLKKIVDANEKESSSWNTLYEIGKLQGEMNLLASLADPEIIRIHHSSRASRAISEEHEKRREVKAQEELLLDQRLLKYLKLAEKEWNKETKIIYHSAMADWLIKEYPELKGDRAILVKKLRPIARKYRYSDFSQGEFKKKSPTIMNICQSLNNDRYGMRFTAPDNTIDRLNEVIRTPDFYAQWYRKHRTINLPPEAVSLVTETQGYRKKKFSEMTEDEQTNIKRLNRLLLERTYPMTPKSLKNGLMRGWEGKKK